MNLTELQDELRSLETQIAKLQTKVEQMKPKSQEQKNTQFEQITRLARQYPLDKPFLCKEPEYLRKQYITCLSQIVTLEEQNNDRLLYLTRLSFGLQLTYTAEEIVRMGLNTKLEDLDSLFEALEPFKYSLLVDILILVNCAGCGSKEALALAVNYATAMKCDTEDVKVCAQVSKAVLINDFDILKELPLPKDNRWQGVFRNHIPVDWIKEQRVLHVFINSKSYCWYDPTSWAMSGPCEVISQIQNGDIAKRGDILIKYRYSGTNDVKTVHAKIDGIAYFKESVDKDTDKKSIKVYVCSWFDWLE